MVLTLAIAPIQIPIFIKCLTMLTLQELININIHKKIKDDDKEYDHGIPEDGEYNIDTDDIDNNEDSDGDVQLKPHH